MWKRMGEKCQPIRRLGTIGYVGRARLAEASFVDCSVEFTKTSRAVSIVIAMSCNVPGANPEAAGDAPKPLQAICGAVNPRIPH